VLRLTADRVRPRLNRSQSLAFLVTDMYRQHSLDDAMKTWPAERPDEKYLT
jgi:hypothetical protein